MNGVSIASSSTVVFPLKSAATRFPKSSFNGVRLRTGLPLTTPSASIAHRNSPAEAVVMMAKRDEELKDIRAKSTEQINEEVVDLKGELLMLSLQRSARNEFKSSEFLRMSERAQEMATRAAEADPMGMLLKERIVFLGSQIDDLVADAIISQLLLLDAQDPTKDIRLFINSPGGSLSATMAIYDIVQLVRADVSTVGLGISASTASIILGGGTKGKRLAMPNTRIMIHQPLGGASGQAIDVEIQAKEVMHNKNNVTRIISSVTGRSFEQVEKDIDRDRYMSPIEAVEYGLIDVVIDQDSIIPLVPVPEKVKPRVSFDEVRKDPRKFLTPEIPDDEIY